ncbi:hypothetical protein [Candidatus Pelagibacter sp. HIMB1611]|uniref:hypothetical protein n=1 Tax=Candidatus Pelagibacter sp. HIMB1611 TaxID=3413357 RepID=UPI003F840FE7
MRFAIILFLILFSQSSSKADHILKEGVFKNDPVYHNDKKFILSCTYGKSGKYHVILDINGDNANVYNINKNEVYYFNDVEVSDPNTVYKGGYDWNILSIGGYIAVELNLLRIHYGYASKEEVPNGKDLYGPCSEINEVNTKNISKRYN